MGLSSVKPYNGPMAILKLAPERSIVLLIDVQEGLIGAIDQGERVAIRCEFLLRIADVLGIPALCTEQNPTRMGGTVPTLRDFFESPIAKMSFSAAGSSGLMSQLEASGRHQVILLGTETHICVSQTALDLLDQGFDVVVCPDAVSARTNDRHKLGMERMRDAGVIPAHTEAAAYEWLGSAEHPKFKEALAIVKSFASDRRIQ